MIIKADQEGLTALSELVDIALKTTGLKGLQRIQDIMKNIRPIDEGPATMNIVEDLPKTEHEEIPEG